MNAEPESDRLLRGLTLVFGLALFALAVLAILYGWPAEKVGNAYQLLGLLIALLGVPVVSPWLARLEVHAARLWVAAGKAITARVRAGKMRVARLLRRPVPHHVGLKSSLSAKGTMHATGGIVRADYSGMSTEELAVRALDEIGWLREEVRALEDGRKVDREEVEGRIESLRAEFQRHVVSVTREGWHYIVSGAAVTAFGIGLTLTT